MEVLKTTHEQFWIDKDKEISLLKERTSKEITDLMLENSNL